MAIKLITAPTEEPITLDEAKGHLRVDHSDEDLYIQGLIVAARETAEHITGRALMLQTWEMAFDGFGAEEIAIQKPPLVNVSSIKYIDGGGILQTLDQGKYFVDAHSEPARILPAYGESWPHTRRQVNSVLIRYTCGYPDADAVPQAIKNWMLLTIGKLYENRESVVAGISITELPHADALLDQYRVWGFA